MTWFCVGNYLCFWLWQMTTKWTILWFYSSCDLLILTSVKELQTKVGSLWYQCVCAARLYVSCTILVSVFPSWHWFGMLEWKVFCSCDWVALLHLRPLVCLVLVLQLVWGCSSLANDLLVQCHCWSDEDAGNCVYITYQRTFYLKQEKFYLYSQLTFTVFHLLRMWSIEPPIDGPNLSGSEIFVLLYTVLLSFFLCCYDTLISLLWRFLFSFLDLFQWLYTSKYLVTSSEL